MDRWVGKVALVSGASSGIGNSIARKLAEHGMKVLACDRSKQQVDELTAAVNGKGELFPYQCDVKDEKQIIGMFDFIRNKFGTIHVCVNTAGQAYKSSILSGNTEEWRDMFDVNVIGLCICCRESVKLMRESGVDDGHVININSMSGHRVVDLHLYAASKFAVTALSEGLRKELNEAKTHIRCTSISPGMVETQFAPRLNKDTTGEKDWYSSMKCLQAEDIADAVLFALQAPSHVNVNEIMIRPTEQAK
uniref:Dehydrogenase/reductase SDR family member 11 n=1 Tax=Phallusia mammillata TaxID=59560 RepID=A0A6F9DAA6_9ASCI|nr:dehydrogenase/reductase SDR family member 11-like [Phallusia mammillata]